MVSTGVPLISFILRSKSFIFFIIIIYGWSIKQDTVNKKKQGRVGGGGGKIGNLKEIKIINIEK